MNYSGSGSVLIVGGFGALSRALIPKLDDKGYHIVIADLRREEDSPFATRPYYQLDVRKPESVDAARKNMEADDRQITHVVNVVGLLMESGLTKLRKSTPREIADTIDLNLTGQINVVHAMAPHVAASQRSDKSFVIVSSINGFRAISIPAYSAAKAGLIGFLGPAAMDLGEEGIRINAISLGTIPTPETKNQPKNIRARAKATALGRLCSPEEAADGIVACITLTGMTGHNLIIDAGQSLPIPRSLYEEARRSKRLRQKIENFQIGSR